MRPLCTCVKYHTKFILAVYLWQYTFGRNLLTPSSATSVHLTSPPPSLERRAPQPTLRSPGIHICRHPTALLTCWLLVSASAQRTTPASPSHHLRPAHFAPFWVVLGCAYPRTGQNRSRWLDTSSVPGTQLNRFRTKTEVESRPKTRCSDDALRPQTRPPQTYPQPMLWPFWAVWTANASHKPLE